MILVFTDAGAERLLLDLAIAIPVPIAAVPPIPPNTKFLLRLRRLCFLLTIFSAKESSRISYRMWRKTLRLQARDISRRVLKDVVPLS